MNPYMLNDTKRAYELFRSKQLKYNGEDDRIVFPLLAGLALTAPFWAGRRRCCPPYYRQPYPLPTPYPYYYPMPFYPSPYFYYNRQPFYI